MGACSETNSKWSGALLSARHSIMPNRLGYCGPDDNNTILSAIETDKPSRELVNVLSGFQGAFPYLRFLADQNGGDDPFDHEVTEAYWIGNSLLDKILPDAFYQHLRKKLSRKFSAEHVKNFFRARPYSSFPHHSLHVFNAFSMMGTVPDSFASGIGPDDRVGQLMDKCRISWAKVVNVSSDDLVVEYEPIVRREGQLRLGYTMKKTLTRAVNGSNLMPDVKTGDWVSAHWDFACAILSPAQLADLQRFTLSSMELANTVPIPE